MGKLFVNFFTLGLSQKAEKRCLLISCQLNIYLGFPGGSVVKDLLASAGDLGSIPIGKIPWRRKWQPTLVFFPGKSYGQISYRQRSLVGCSPWGPKESDTAEQLNNKHTLTLRPSSHTLGNLSRRNKDLCSDKNLYMGVHSIFICNSLKVGTIQMSSSG